ncbi:MAG: helix-turn-helix transcriptional regulator [Desulfosalsimonadaceae bacterium]
MTIKELFGRRIQEIRKRQKLSQEQIAEKAGISSNYLSRIECGKENPTLDMLIKLGEALTTEIWEMFDFGHTVNSKELRESIQKFSQKADENMLRTIVQIIKIFER